MPKALAEGWSLSGITRFASGFPVTMINNGDNSLIGTNPNGVNNSSIDEPDYSGGPLQPEPQSPHEREQLLRPHSLQHECAGHAGQRQAAVLSWSGRGQLRYGGCQEPAAHANRSRCSSALKHSTSSITRSSTAQFASTATSAARHSAMRSAQRLRAFCRAR